MPLATRDDAIIDTTGKGGKGNPAARNAGAEPSIVIDRIRSGKGAYGFNAAIGRYVFGADLPVPTREGAYGFNAAIGQYEDLTKAGIVDPTKVVRIAGGLAQCSERQERGCLHRPGMANTKQRLLSVSEVLPVGRSRQSGSRASCAHRSAGRRRPGSESARAPTASLVRRASERERVRVAPSSAPLSCAQICRD